jgi:osmoprotectant transport system permease protein
MNLLSYLENGANWTGSDGLLVELGQHMLYTVVAVALAAILGIAIGLVIGHTGRGDFIVIALSNAFRAVPMFGLLILVVLLSSTGWIPVIITLGILAMPPILTNTATGIQQADPSAVHAARALGMSGGQILRKVEWPLATPLVIAGLRSATLQVVATATIAAYAVAGGLGRAIFNGIHFGSYPQVFAGAVLVGALAIVLDVLLSLAYRAAQRHAYPGSLRKVRVAKAA